MWQALRPKDAVCSLNGAVEVVTVRTADSPAPAATMVTYGTLETLRPAVDFGSGACLREWKGYGVS